MSGESSPVSCRGAGEIRSRALPRDLLSTRQLSVVHHPVHAAETCRPPDPFRKISGRFVCREK
jgi:hypothetical protein